MTPPWRIAAPSVEASGMRLAVTLVSTRTREQRVGWLTVGELCALLHFGPAGDDGTASRESDELARP